MASDSFGERFRRVRFARGKTQSEIASEIGVHAQTISVWERNALSALPPAELVRKAARLLDVDFMWLAFREGRAPSLRS